MVSLSVLHAANALVVPVPPNNIDFALIAHYSKIMTATLADITEVGGARGDAFVKNRAAWMNDGKSAHVAITRMMDAVFAGDMFQAVFKNAAEIDNTTASLRTVYDLTGAATRIDRRSRTWVP